MGSPLFVKAPAGTTRLILLLLAGALVLRLGVIAVASVAAPDDISNDVKHHAMLVDDPVDHLRHAPGMVEQYPPYLGFAEWITVKPWLALGANDATAQRLGSSIWDLAGMAVLLLVVANRRRSDILVVGALWGAALLFWPTSALLGQDETIAAAFVAVAVLLAARHRRVAACAVLIVGLFVAKVFLLAVLLAFLLTAPASQRRRAWSISAIVFAFFVVVTWIASGTDGLSQQLRYEIPYPAFTMSPWSTLLLHHQVSGATAHDGSIVLSAAAAIAVLVLWWFRRGDGADGAPRLAAALLLAVFAFLAVSNPEYLCIAAPVAIFAALLSDDRVVLWALVISSALAWAVNGVYHLLKTTARDRGYELGLRGFHGEITGRLAVLDVLHRGLLVALWLALLFTAYRLATRPGARAPVG
jgi:hypothetical protein